MSIKLNAITSQNTLILIATAVTASNLTTTIFNVCSPLTYSLLTFVIWLLQLVTACVVPVGIQQAKRHEFQQFVLLLMYYVL